MYLIQTEQGLWIETQPSNIQHLQKYRFIDENGGILESYWYKEQEGLV